MSKKSSLDRIVFLHPGEQADFIMKAKEELNLTSQQLVELLKIHPRTLREWVNEKYNMSYDGVLFLTIRGVAIPRNIKIKRWKEHLAKSAHKGGMARYKKYGRVALNEEYRQQKWLEWWKAKGKYLQSPIHNEPLSFHTPQQSKELAEFVGIMLGDGGVSKYQLVITLHRYDDYQYSLFVRKLIMKLFHVKAGKSMAKDALADNIIISRIKMVEYAVKSLGLVVGNKVRQQVGVSNWIKLNKEFSFACVRGLVDTDGCIFTHKYKVKGKEYRYKKLSFTNSSQPLLIFVYDVLLSIGIKPRLAVAGNRSDVRIDSKADMKRYFKVIGSHNPKHLKRYAL